MVLSPNVDLAFRTGFVTCWILSYTLIIYQGFRDKTFGMPLVAMCANISWELIFSFIFPSPPPQLYFNITWFLVDLIIIYQGIRFGANDFKNISATQFYWGFALIFTLSFLTMLFTIIQFNDWGSVYTGFAEAMNISALFIAMLLRRNSVRGQSMYIGMFKLIGNLIASIFVFIQLTTEILLYYFFVAIFILDLVYVVLLHSKFKELKLNPWIVFRK